MKKDKRWCLICNPKNRTLYFHLDEKTGKPWIFCNKCNRGYSLKQYCELAGIDEQEFSEDGFEIEDAKENEVNVLSWPKNFIPLSDPRATKGLEYIKRRGISPDGDMYYDIDDEGIVFPYYYNNHFVGAQVRFLEPRIDEDGEEHKITTLYGTRLGMLFGLWNQAKFMPHIKGIGICEGYFNALALQQAFNIKYGGVLNNPWKFICTSGAGVSNHQAEVIKEIRKSGRYKVIGAFDCDDAGLNGINKLILEECIDMYSVTADDEKDWNDCLLELGHTGLFDLFIKNIHKI